MVTAEWSRQGQPQNDHIKTTIQTAAVGVSTEKSNNARTAATRMSAKKAGVPFGRQSRVGSGNSMAIVTGQQQQNGHDRDGHRTSSSEQIHERLRRINHSTKAAAGVTTREQLRPEQPQWILVHHMAGSATPATCMATAGSAVA